MMARLLGHPPCGKIGYPSVGSARAALEQARSRGEHRHEKNVYQCSRCLYWHLTKSTRSNTHRVQDANPRRIGYSSGTSTSPPQEEP